MKNLVQETLKNNRIVWRDSNMTWNQRNMLEGIINQALTNDPRRLSLIHKRIRNEGCQVIADVLHRRYSCDDGNTETETNNTDSLEDLTEIHLGANRIGWEGCRIITNALFRLDNDHNSSKSSKNARLKISNLNLYGNQIGNAGCDFLANVLRKNGNNTLRHLNLSLNGITSQGCRVLSNALKNNTALEELNLRANQIGVRGCEALASGALLSNNTLRSLNLGLNSIGSEGCQHLADALRTNKDTNITDLNLAFNGIDDEGCIALARALSCCDDDNDNDNDDEKKTASSGTDTRSSGKIKQLKLPNNNIGDDGCQALSNYLLGCNNNSLHYLDLSSNSIGNEGSFTLASALCGDAILENLLLFDNAFDCKGCHAFAEALRIGNTTLIELTLSRYNIAIMTASCERHHSTSFSASKNNNGNLIHKHHSDTTQFCRNSNGRKDNGSNGINTYIPYEHVMFYLKINRLGRHHFFYLTDDTDKRRESSNNTNTSNNDMVETLVNVRNDVESFLYLLSLRPELCFTTLALPQSGLDEEKNRKRKAIINDVYGDNDNESKRQSKRCKSDY